MDAIRIWGRANSVNVQKVLWCLGELDLPFERIDAGMAFGHVDTVEYRAINPNGRVPTLVHGDFVLWESNSVMRYLAMMHPGPLYPVAPAVRASVDRWLDWILTTLQPAERNLFWGMVRTAPAERDMAVIGAAAKASAACWVIVDTHLGHGRPFMEGESFTLADIVIGAYARRWFGVDVADRPDLPRLRAWYDAVSARPAFQRYLAAPLS